MSLAHVIWEDDKGKNFGHLIERMCVKRVGRNVPYRYMHFYVPVITHYFHYFFVDLSPNEE